METLSTQLEGWRQQRGGRCRLPEALWDAAGALARREGVSRVSLQLGLGYHRLRRITEAQSGVGPGGTPKVQFVELTRPPTSVATADGYRIVLEDGGGRSLRVELGGDREALERLVAQCWRGVA
ncbi:MAG: hypothetical protein KF791_17530 [Verrucomicrobiae bacterium]|nr:hypothetical protein [Verrucomicrobiae bacterium]